MSSEELPKAVTGEAEEFAEFILIERGTSQIEVDDGDRLFVKCFDESGNVIFHGEAAGCHIEALGPKGKA